MPLQEAQAVSHGSARWSLAVEAVATPTTGTVVPQAQPLAVEVAQVLASSAPLAPCLGRGHLGPTVAAVPLAAAVTVAAVEEAGSRQIWRTDSPVATV
jgi:hypothetical protein